MATMSAPSWLQTPHQGYSRGSSGLVFGGPAPTPTQVQQPVREFVELPRGLITEEFSLSDVANSLTNSKLYRIIAGAAGVTTAQIPIRPLFRGSVVGLALQATAAKTAGTATFRAFVKGSGGVSLIWANGETHAETSVPAGTYAFGVGDGIDVRVTTDGSFAPATADVEVILYLAQSAAGSET